MESVNYTSNMTLLLKQVIIAVTFLLISPIISLSTFRREAGRVGFCNFSSLFIFFDFFAHNLEKI